MTQPSQNPNAPEGSPPLDNELKQTAHQLLHIQRKNRLRRFFFLQGLVVVGASISALGYVLFQLPYQLAAGGVTGLAIIINQFLHLPQGLLVFLLTAPLMVWGFFQLGRWRFLFSTIVAVSVFSLATDIFNTLLPGMLDPYPITDNRLLASIYAGLLFGVGLGLVSRAGGTMGGSSVPARILHKKTGFPMSQSFMIVDMSVILLAGLVFDWERALLAFLTMILYGIASDFVLEGASQVRTAVIVSDRVDLIRYGLEEALGGTVNVWPISGGYSASKKTMIYCTVNRAQASDLRFAVGQIDPDAFLVLGIAQQAWGGPVFRPLRKADG